MYDSPIISFQSLAPEQNDFYADVINGLGREQKTLPCKYLYDYRGSALFEKICELEEYYPTRTELALMRERANEISSLVGRRAQIVEPGSGSIEKVRVLLDALDDPASYVAIDISRELLVASAESLAADYPDIEVHAIHADFAGDLDLLSGIPGERRVAFFPGSTIGNFEPEAAAGFLTRLASLVGSRGACLIGVDLKKEQEIFHSAYNDREGVTAAFNLNLLHRMNSELGAEFNISRFRHQALYNEGAGRVEMHIESICSQTVSVAGQLFEFRAGETIHTENSYKYSISEFHGLAESCGFESNRVWTDRNSLFSIHFLEATA